MPEVISSMVLGTFLPGVAKEPGSMPAFVAVAPLPPTIVSSEGPGAPCITLSWLCCTFCPPWVYLCRETHVWIKNRGSHSALSGLVFKVPTPLKAAMCALVSVSGDQDLKGTGRMWQNLWGGLIICAGGAMSMQSKGLLLLMSQNCETPLNRVDLTWGTQPFPSSLPIQLASCGAESKSPLAECRVTKSSRELLRHVPGLDENTTIGKLGDSLVKIKIITHILLITEVFWTWNVQSI